MKKISNDSQYLNLTPDEASALSELLLKVMEDTSEANLTPKEKRAREYLSRVREALRGQPSDD